MAAFIGNLQMAKAYVGNTPLSKIFAGELLIWPTGSSYPTGQVSPVAYPAFYPPAEPDFGSGIGGSDAYFISNAPDGGYYVGGNFTSFDGVSLNRIVKLNSDGSIDGNFNVGTGFDGPVRNAVIGEFTGNLHICGAFNTYRGTTSRKIVTVNPSTGAIVRAYTYASTSGAAYDAVEIDSTKLIVSGTNTGWSGLRMWNMSTGAQDTVNFSFSPGGTTGQVWAIERFANGNIICGGTMPSGFTYNRCFIINSNGSFNTSACVNIQAHGFTNQVSLLKKYNGTTIIAAGYVNTVGAWYLTSRILKVYDDGTYDQNFKTNSTGVITNTAFGLDIKNDVITLVGPFSTAREYPYTLNGDAIFFDMDGNKIWEDNVIEGDGFQNGGVMAASGGVVFVQSISSTNVNWEPMPSTGIYYFYPSTGGQTGQVAPTDFQNGIQGTVYSIETYGQKLLVAGDIQSYNGTTVTSNLIRLNSDGTLDETFFPPDITGAIRKILYVPSSETILVGGEFSGYFKALNASTGSVNSNWTATFDGIVRCFSYNIYNKGIAIGGDFTGGVRVYSNKGVLDTSFSFGSGTNAGSRVNDIWYSQQNRRILIAGSFTTFNGQTAKGMASINFDGSLDTAFSTGVTGFGGGEPYCMYLDQYGDSMFVGGSFSSYKGNQAGNFTNIRLSNGDSDYDPEYPDDAWTRANQFNGPVHTIKYMNEKIGSGTINPKYFVGGNFSSYITGSTGYNMQTVYSQGIAKIDANYYSDPQTFDVGAGTNGTVYAIKTQYPNYVVDPSRQNLFIGGTYTQFKGNAHNKIVHVGATGTVLPL
jgi:hypothetical protein